MWMLRSELSISLKKLYERRKDTRARPAHEHAQFELQAMPIACSI